MAVVSPCRKMSGIIPGTGVTLAFSCTPIEFNRKRRRRRMCNAGFLERNRTTSSHYGLYGLGYTCATVVTTKRSKCASRSKSINVICDVRIVF